MRQGELPYQYIPERSESGLTSLAGLPAYLDLMHVMGLRDSIDGHVRTRAASQGWSDGEVIMSLILLNLAGGSAVDDLRVLEADVGLGRVLRASRAHGAPRVTAMEKRKRWRKPTERSVPSPSAAFRYLRAFHDEKQEAGRRPGKAFIPTPNDALRGLARVSACMLAFLQANSPCVTATLDMDATLVETSKEAAFYSYQKSRAYQPLSAYWYEQDALVHSEFRDGNVPAGHQQLRVLTDALAALPAGIEQVRLRSDAAGYQRELLAYCAEGKSERFGIIDFTVSVGVTEAFRDAIKAVPEEEWRPVAPGSSQEWAEVCFVPNWVAAGKTNPEYRYLAVREPLRQQPLFLAESEDTATEYATADEAEGAQGAQGAQGAAGAEAACSRHCSPASLKRRCPATGSSVLEAHAAELPLLGPIDVLPEPFDLAVTRRVNRDCTVQFEGRTYSVPFQHVGREVEVLGCAGSVLIVAGAVTLARHPRGTSERILLDQRHFEGTPTNHILPPQPLGRMGARLQEIYDLTPEARPLDLYAALMEVAR